MDGLSTADDCTFTTPIMKDLAVMLHNTQVYRAKYLDGGLPQCIFQMSNLSSIYMAGNGLIGTLPSLDPTSNLETISLSHNRFYGQIPQSMQTWSKMISLDLSFNRLSGTVNNMNYSAKMVIVPSSSTSPSGTDTDSTVGDTTSSPFLGLKSNRLSGDIPSFFAELDSIDVLSGNLFDCSIDTLPRNDPAFESYWCASMYLYSMWGAVFSVFVLSLAFIVIVGVVLRFCFSEDIYEDATVIFNRIRTLSYINEIDKRDGTDRTERASILSPYMNCIQWICYTMFTFVRGFFVTMGRVFIKVVAFPPGVISTKEKENHTVPIDPAVPFSFPLSNYNDKLLLMGDTASTKYNKQKYNTNKMHRDIVNVLYLFVTMRRFALFVLIVSVLIFLPTYSLLKVQFDSSTHTYQYGWFFSLAYIQSSQAGGTILVMWSCFMGFVAVLSVFTEARRIYIRLFVAPSSRNVTNTTGIGSNNSNNVDATLPLPLRKSTSHRDTIESESTSADYKPKTPTTKNYSTYYLVKIYLLVLMLINCLVMVILNGFYIYMQISQTPLVAAVSLYMFVAIKTIWNVKVVPLLLRSRPKVLLKLYYRVTSACYTMFSNENPYRDTINNYESVRMSDGGYNGYNGYGENNVNHEQTEDLKRSDIRSGATHCMLLIFNNIIAPGIATFFSDSNCINSLIISPKPIESSFQYPLCVDFDAISMQCREFKLNVLETDFDPPFMYSFQCGSSLLTNYVPVFLLMYGIGGILVPCIQWLTVIVLEYYYRNEIYDKTGRKYVIGGTKKKKLRVSETRVDRVVERIDRIETKHFQSVPMGGAEELSYTSQSTPLNTRHGDELSHNSHSHNPSHNPSPNTSSPVQPPLRAGMSTNLSSCDSDMDSYAGFHSPPDSKDQDDQDDTNHIDDSDNSDADDRDSFGSNVTVETNTSEKQETDRQIRRDKLEKSVKFYQKVVLYCTFGMISEMHWPILFCPDLSSIRNPDDPNNLYRIQNMTCGAITGIAVLMSK